MTEGGGRGEDELEADYGEHHEAGQWGHGEHQEAGQCSLSLSQKRE